MRCEATFSSDERFGATRRVIRKRSWRARDHARAIPLAARAVSSSAENRANNVRESHSRPRLSRVFDEPNRERFFPSPCTPSTFDHASSTGSRRPGVTTVFRLPRPLASTSYRAHFLLYCRLTNRCSRRPTIVSRCSCPSARCKRSASDRGCYSALTLSSCSASSTVQERGSSASCKPPF